MGIIGKPNPANVAAAKRYWERLERARQIDPEAFKGYSVTHFFPEQQARQVKAIEQAEAELDNR